MKIIAVILIALLIRDYVLIYKSLKKFPLKLMVRVFFKAPAAKNLRFQLLGDTLDLIFIIGWWIR